MERKCAGVMPECPGTERFVGGTGKYTGISDEQRIQGNFIGDTTLAQDGSTGKAITSLLEARLLIETVGKGDGKCRL